MSGGQALETESAYVVRGEASPETITRSLQALLPTRHRPIARHQITLLDTFDGRVRRAGTRLTRCASTLALEPCAGGRHLTLRLSQPVSFIWDFPEGPFHNALAPLIGVRRLLPLADAEEYGSLLDILDPRGKTVARLRIESGRARQSSQAWQPLPTVVTLAGLHGYSDDYRRLVPLVESRPGLEPCPEGLHGLLLRQVGVPQHGDLSLPRVDLDPSVRADVGAARIHQALLGVLKANEPGLRASLDTEFLHDFRVAVRRMRSLLGQIKHVFPPEAVEHFASELSWLGRLTGTPRDLDVLLLALRGRDGAIPDEDMEALRAFLGQRQQQEHGQLVTALDSDRYRRLLSEWNTLLTRPAPSASKPRNADRPLAAVVSERAWRLSRRISRGATTLGAHASADQLHRVRIDAKKLRYLIDVTPTFYDAADLDRVLRALKRLQRVLGDFNDSHVQEGRLIEYGRSLGAAGGPAGALLAFGQLAERSRQRGERLRRDIGDGLARFGARDTRSACSRAFKRATAGEDRR
jgi:CHAD domain-containing protein